MRTLTASTVALSLLLTACSPPADAQLHTPKLELPDRPKAVRFAVIGDTGTGTKEQYEVAAQMAAVHQTFQFEFVLMLGDNVYGHKTADDFKRKFENPYKVLLDHGVKFYASLGNHDNPNELYYRPFNMDGQRYYTIKTGDVEFFALDSTYVDTRQLDWLRNELSNSGARWKICFFHHPIYSNSRHHGPDTDLRRRIEPIFRENGVDVVLSGHDHVYERLKPQGGVHYFVLGNAGQLRPHDLHPAAGTAKGFDTDRAFMLMELAGDDLYFQTISRTGETVDSGVITSRKHSPSDQSN
jgi:3',5'-cyclic AMP phosphodiesterase CpdA